MGTTGTANSTERFQIRYATPEDLPGAKAVIRGVLDEDLGGYKPDLHWDLERLEETYLQQTRYCLVVAVDGETGAVAGTTAVRPGGPKSPPHPDWLCNSYDPAGTAQLFRVYIDRRFRRNGLARRLVDAARQFIAEDEAYHVIYLHTNPASPGAEAFWRSMPTKEIYDSRTEGGPMQTLHFEMQFPDGSYRR